MRERERVLRGVVGLVSLGGGYPFITSSCTYLVLEDTVIGRLKGLGTRAGGLGYGKQCQDLGIGWLGGVVG
jgi:hypothetical protein